MIPVALTVMWEPYLRLHGTPLYVVILSYFFKKDIVVEVPRNICIRNFDVIRACTTHQITRILRASKR
jgi:hypothetical protein